MVSGLRLHFLPALSALHHRLGYAGSRASFSRSAHFQPGVYSTLAGFIEPGESVENAVYREVKEEAGIAIQICVI